MFQLVVEGDMAHHSGEAWREGNEVHGHIMSRVWQEKDVIFFFFIQLYTWCLLGDATSCQVDNKY